MKTQTKVEKEKLRLLKYSPLAEKYGCSVGYVRMVLLGERVSDSVRAQKILRDAVDMLEILERETKVTL
ncbi:hypothetical protein GGR21_000741 [Dysgonomonas hofstadii]|uniref:Transcriptional regulator n=1 Tax=Dysgonomonas hofstadii TaxID=637886 RepID=A0A840CMV8_9BACT|nr:hypothetical protein [Dysgonomonas hofstadii]MBB4034854.1 hypothetical protein [Dysgonomonas hofstadii]